MYRIVWYVGKEAPQGEWDIERAGTGEYATFDDALAEVRRRNELALRLEDIEQRRGCERDTRHPTWNPQTNPALDKGRVKPDKIKRPKVRWE